MAFMLELSNTSMIILKVSCLPICFRRSKNVWLQKKWIKSAQVKLIPTTVCALQNKVLPRYNPSAFFDIILISQLLTVNFWGAGRGTRGVLFIIRFGTRSESNNKSKLLITRMLSFIKNWNTPHVPRPTPQDIYRKRNANQAYWKIPKYWRLKISFIV